MKIAPYTDNFKNQRLELLQSRLRGNIYDFPIELEYPLLFKSKNCYSLCISENDTLIAHLQIWPRQLYQNNKIIGKIGLIGNVATHKSHERKGLMRKLMEHGKNWAKQEGIEALILWSDLISFYKKIDFIPFGKEYHLDFNIQSLEEILIEEEFLYIEADKASPKILQDLLQLRIQGKYELERTLKEFQELLTIPNTALLVARDFAGFTAYAIVGKGADFPCYIHEWGAKSIDSMLMLLRFILEKTEWEKISILCPGFIHQDYLKNLEKFSTKIENRHMALIYESKERKIEKIFKSSFIWGLDSI